MSTPHAETIAAELSLTLTQVAATAELLASGATVPFIARYRKEATGSLDEVAVAAVRDRLAQLQALESRRAAILGSLEERGLLSSELEGALRGAQTLALLEDLYLPYRPKRRTRAAVARERGLEPLALRLWAQDPADSFDPLEAALPFVDAEKGLASPEEVLAGARDILAEMASENAEARGRMRELFFREARFTAKVVAGKETDGAKFRDYFDWSEPAAAAPSHRILAMRRGEKEGFLTLKAAPPEEEALALLEGLFLRGSGPVTDQVRLALADGYKRLLAPSMETELRLETKRRADEAAIRVFAENLRVLLLAAPLGRKAVLGVDPGLRTGCKLAFLDPQGKLLHHDVVYLTGSDREAGEAREKLLSLVERFGTEAVAVGNGTGGREAEIFFRRIGLPKGVAVVMVNESGASIYSASEVAREEFPDLDLTVRGAVSIGRRLQDPLAELVKIDPKSIGVGQYQHDMDQAGLKRSLDDVVASCVNRVGVEVNTASRQLLAYVSGLGPQLAARIVEYREARGPFRNRRELLEVPRLGPKAFEQAAGFLRIRDGEEPLDASAVHPERYGVVEAMARDLGCSVAGLLRKPELRARIEPRRYVTAEVGLPTLTDILAELEKPGRDPRERFEPFAFAEGIEKIEELRPGMRLPGIVTNVTAFGAFVDVGVHQDGLVHVSQLADRYVKDPSTVVKAGQRVMVNVLEVDLQRRRIGLSMKGVSQSRGEDSPSKSGPAPGEGGAGRGRSSRPPRSNWFTEAMAKGKRSS
jgi:uncharacterized protein